MTRIVYYTHPHFLDLALHFAREMAKATEFHLMIEVSPGAWEKGLFDMKERELPEGIVPAKPIFEKHYPPTVAEYWSDVASFNLVSSRTPRTMHPRSFLTSQAAAGFIKKLQPDILHIDDVDTSMRLSLAAWQLSGLRIILNVHDPTPHSGEQNWRKNLARKLTYRHVNRFVLHNASQADAFSAAYGIRRDRISVNHLGVYEIAKEISEPVQMDSGNVLFFGRISKYKGLPTLLAAAPKVISRVPDASFTSAGKMAENMRDTMLILGDRVSLMDRYVDNRELGELFQKAAVVACPYTDATQSGVILSAYGFGKPVVASRVGGLPEYVDDGESGLLVPPGDPEALADALIRVLTDQTLAARLSDGVRALREGRLSWQRMGQQTLNTYESVLKE